MGHPMRLELSRAGLLVECFSGSVTVYIEVTVLDLSFSLLSFSQSVSISLSLSQLVFDI